MFPFARCATITLCSAERWGSDGNQNKGWRKKEKKILNLDGAAGRVFEDWYVYQVIGVMSEETG